MRQVPDIESADPAGAVGNSQQGVARATVSTSMAQGCCGAATPAREDGTEQLLVSVG
jgi:hypothetical protein